MRTLLTETPVGPIATATSVLILAKDTVPVSAPVAADPGPSLRAPRVPQDLLGYSALTQARRSTSAKLVGLELPSSFVAATIACEARLLAKSVELRTDDDKRALRRLSSKVRRLGAA
jgi:hypothetical protein